MKREVETPSGAPARRECPWRDSATAHVLGALSDVESRAYVAHVEQGCAPCAGELELAESVVAQADAVIERERMIERDGGIAPEPPSGLRERVLAAIRGEPQDPPPHLDRTWQRWRASDARREIAPGIVDVHGGEGAWESIGRPGIEVKRLSVDGRRRFVTMLIRMAPGASYPPHRHAGDEQCFVIAGDLTVGDRVLRAGDFQLASAGSVHGVQSTEKGCTLLIVSSQDDELV